MQAEVLEKIRQYAEQQMAKDKSGHGWDHIQRVVRLTKRISVNLPVDGEVAQAAALLHDVCDDKLVTNVPAAKQAMIAQLKSIGVTDNELTEILAIIDHLSFSKSLNGPQKLSLTGQVVQDADRLDAIGAIGIARALYYSGHAGEVIYDPTIPPRMHMTKEQYRNEPGTAINHFSEKLFKLADLMNTQPAKELAQARNAEMHHFVTEFIAEWQGEK